MKCKYKTFYELLNVKWMIAATDRDYYYIKVKTSHKYDNEMYMVNRKTKTIATIFFTTYICKYRPNSTEYKDPEEFREKLLKQFS